MSVFFSLLFFAAVAGIVYPYLRRWKRKHFALVAVGAFIAVGLTAPEPTPQELAERKAKEAAEAEAEVAKAGAEKAQTATKEHAEVVEKARLGLEVPANYTRSEFGDTFKRVGAATFAKLNELESGAVYAAAESRSCDKVHSASVSDTSKPNAAVWFVDCGNENRFMVTQKQAANALTRFKGAQLALSALENTCTLSSISLCKERQAESTASVAQLAAKEKEVELVSICDMVLDQALVSPSSIDMVGSWSFSFGKGDDVQFTRDFDSQNGFGAMIRSQYRCTMDSAVGKIKRFVIDGPAGSQRVI